MIVQILSFVAFILVAIGLQGIKIHHSAAQKIMMASQVCWAVVGSLSDNWLLVVQSIYLLYVSWSTDRYWRKKGLYEF